MKLLIAVLSLVGTAHAAGSGAHHGSVADLILPASNFVILAGALIFIMRKPLGEMFSKNAKDVEYLLEHAQKLLFREGSGAVRIPRAHQVERRDVRVDQHQLKRLAQRLLVPGHIAERARVLEVAQLDVTQVRDGFPE